MTAALKLLVGLILILAVHGCRCCDNHWHDTCRVMAPRAPVAGAVMPPEVTVQ